MCGVRNSIVATGVYCGAARRTTSPRAVRVGSCVSVPQPGRAQLPAKVGLDPTPEEQLLVRKSLALHVHRVPGKPGPIPRHEDCVGVVVPREYPPDDGPIRELRQHR